MKHLTLTILFILSLVFSAFSQSQCPKITMTTSDSLIKIGDSLTFSVNVEGIESQKLKFVWTTSNGTIVNGQETAKIIVATTPDMAGMTITATVEITGLPQDCLNIASFFGSIEKGLPACVLPVKLDEIYKSSWQDEKRRIQNAAYQLQKTKDFGIVVKISAPQSDKTGFIKNRSERFRKFLTEVSKVPKDKIKIVSGGSNDYVIEFYLVPLLSFDEFQDEIKATPISSSPQSQSKRRKGN